MKLIGVSLSDRPVVVVPPEVPEVSGLDVTQTQCIVHYTACVD